jgi:hypothetical protein
MERREFVSLDRLDAAFVRVHLARVDGLVFHPLLEELRSWLCPRAMHWACTKIELAFR